MFLPRVLFDRSEKTIVFDFFDFLNFLNFLTLIINKIENNKQNRISYDKEVFYVSSGCPRPRGLRRR